MAGFFQNSLANSKLLALFQTFDRADLRQLANFVQSPYFNKKEELVQYFQVLRDLAKENFPEKKLNRESIYKKIFPKQGYDEANFNHLTSQLLKLLERYVQIKRSEENEGQLALYMLEHYQQFHLEKNYRYWHRQALAQTENPEIDMEAELFLEMELASHGNHLFGKIDRKSLQHYFQHQSDALDSFFMLKKLKFLCSMLDHQQIISEEYALHFLDPVMQYIEKNPAKFLTQPLFNIYYNLIEMLLDRDHQAKLYFEQYKRIMLKTKLPVKPRERRDLLTLGINFCMRQIRAGQMNYTKELMDLYDFGIQEQMLLENNRISPYTFKNVVRLGLGLKRLDWTSAFIEQYAPCLPKAMQQDALYYNLAEVNYYQKNFDQALMHLNQAKFKDIHYSLSAKAMLAKIYTENESWEALDSCLSSFSIYLLRQKDIPKSTKVPYQNFVKILQLIAQDGFRYNVSQVKHKINQRKSLHAKSWLTAQANRLLSEE